LVNSTETTCNPATASGDRFCGDPSHGTGRVDIFGDAAGGTCAGHKVLATAIGGPGFIEPHGRRARLL